MATRSLNKVQLIGNLTRDPELRYTPTGAAVCTFSIATNRQWATEGGDKKEEAEFHRVVAWNKLAEICSQLLSKGRRVYIEGRLTTRSWQGQDGQQRQTTEIVANDMIILDNKGMGSSSETLDVPEDLGISAEPSSPTPDVMPIPEAPAEPQPKDSKKKKAEGEEAKTDDNDMPF